MRLVLALSRNCLRAVPKPTTLRTATLTARHRLQQPLSTTQPTPATRLNGLTFQRNMSFSNTDTGSKPADPYTQKNLEQPDDLKTKVGDLVDFVEKHKFCMMTTRIKSGLLASRCMALAAKEGNGVDLIFHTNTESGKTDDLDFDNDINLAFLTPSGEWASISGKASIETDRAQVKKYYSEGLKAWIGDLGDGIHNGGPEDPRIGLIKVKAITAQYAISSRTTVGGFVEFAKGVATGSSPQVHKLRYLSEEELQQWRGQ